MSVYGPRWPATTMPPPKAESSASKRHRAQERQARDGLADGGRNNHQGHEGTRSLDAFPSRTFVFSVVRDFRVVIGGDMSGIPMEYLIIAGLAVLALLLLMSVLARLYRKAGPHEALVVYGFRGKRVITGHGTIVLPMVENCHDLSLELMSFDVAPQQDLYTKQGVAVTVEAVAQIQVKFDTESIWTAAEQFLTKTDQEREGLIKLVMEGHLRGIIGQLTVEEIVKQPEMVGDRMRSTCADDMNKMGLEVISFTIKEVRDKNEYIINMGRPDIARIKRDADVATAEADRDTAIKRALAQRESAVARAQADQERVLAETLSLAKQAEAQRDLEVKKAQYVEVTKRQQAQRSEERRVGKECRSRWSPEPEKKKEEWGTGTDR